MAQAADFPGSLRTNAYILHQFSEIAYIVVADKKTAGDIQPRPPLLPRLKNAQQEFKEASILTVLDAEKLELWTFYKKVDIVNDSSSLLTKFGLVCHRNGCEISHKKACRIIELLQPDNSRVYQLFTNAVIAGVQLQAQHENSLRRINPQTFLLRLHDLDLDKMYLFDKQPARWSLHKIELQILASGQLLLFLRQAKWPRLTAMTDLIDPDVDAFDHEKGATIYLAPTGQIARYNGVWISSMTADQEASVIQRKAGTVKRQQKWLKLAQEWLKGKIDVSVRLQVGTIWLELEIPVLASTDTQEGDNDDGARTLQWKTIYWPASLSYAFAPPANLDHTEEISLSDPIEDARNWLFYDCDAALKALEGERVEDEQHEDRLFDEDINFGSPQQYMHPPMHAFANGQTVYPTPPEGPFTQPTPGFSVDGTVQTPATIPHIHGNTTFSSPLATMTETPMPHEIEREIPEFVEQHDQSEHDDLFDDNGDDELMHDSIMNEPDWDAFEPDVPTSDVPTAEGNGEKSNTNEGDNIARDDHGMNNFSPGLINDVRDESQTQVATLPNDVVSQIPDNEHQNTDTSSHTRRGSEKMEDVPERTAADWASIFHDVGDVARRRSSAYDIPCPIERDVDAKYRTQGKYWFEAAQPMTTVPSTGAQRPASSISDTTSESSASDESMSRPGKQEKEAPAWTFYDPDKPQTASTNDIEDTKGDADAESDVLALLQAIGSAAGTEPFLDAMPVPPANIKHGTQDERSFMVVQTLIEQLTQSTLLRDLEALHLPSTPPTSTMDISINNAESVTVLNGASVTELTTTVPANAAKTSDSRTTKLKNVKVCLSQGDSDIVADVSILKHWQTVGLQPLNGTKDVLAICLHPESENYKSGCETFLARMLQTWDSCNLGAHHEASLKGLTQTGTVAWSDSNELNSFCRHVGEVLAAEGHETCTIIYMIIPNDDMSWCMKLCDAFVELFDALADQRQPDTGDIVLQLVPASFVVASNTIVVPAEESYVDLALEVYHRIPPLEEVVDGMIWAPPLRVEESILPEFTFEMNAKSVSPLKKYGDSFHMSYGLTQDRKWLVTSWCDSTGNITNTVPYRIWNDETEAFVSLQSIYRHMLDASVGFANSQRERWWLAITKSDLYNYKELQDWITVIGKFMEDQKLLSRIVLLNVELSPRVDVLGSTVSTKNLYGNPNNAQNTLHTPVSTPQAFSTTSPGVPVTPGAVQIGAPTPPETTFEHGFDNDVVLKDLTEDVWMITLPFGTNQSHSMHEIRPALASGMLLKRVATESKGELRTTVVGVNLCLLPRKSPATTPVPAHEREQLLQEVMLQYHALHTLAIAKRCIEPNAACVPWHVASVWKGVKCLDYLV